MIATCIRTRYKVQGTRDKGQGTRDKEMALGPFDRCRRRLGWCRRPARLRCARRRLVHIHARPLPLVRVEIMLAQPAVTLTGCRLQMPSADCLLASFAMPPRRASAYPPRPDAPLCMAASAARPGPWSPCCMCCAGAPVAYAGAAFMIVFNAAAFCASSAGAMAVALAGVAISGL